MAPTAPGRHPVHGLPFETAVENGLRAEWERLPGGERRSRMRRVWQRELKLWLTGQSRRRVERAPEGVGRVLWLYNWTTLGDAVMDLAARQSVPAGIRLELCIAPSLVPLFAADPRFAAVRGSVDACDPDVEFILVHELQSRALADKRRRWPATPFATVLNPFMGEQFARTAFVDARIRHVFRLPPAPPPVPTLALGDGPAHEGRFDVAVVLGARDPRRAFPHWGPALQRILDRWPAERPPLRFVLLGSDNAAADRASLEPALLARCEDRVGRTGLIEAVHAVRDADAFLGADGGLMHVAAALDKPGLALFAGIEPRLRLAAESSLRVLFVPGSIASLTPGRVADAFLGERPAPVSLRRG